MKRLLLSSFIAACILAYGPAGIQNTPPPKQEDIYIVQLREPSLAERVMEWSPTPLTGKARLQILRSARAIEHRKRLQSEQERIVEELKQGAAAGAPRLADPVRVTGRQTELLNVLLVRTTREQAGRLALRPDVRGVYRNLERHLLTDAIPGLVGAIEYWNTHGGASQAGAGVRIGVIDSGINIDHPMFQDPLLTYPPGFPPSSANTAFSNSKVIVARTYVDPRYGLEDQEVKTPQDERGHGSNVAAIAAGSPQETYLGRVQGVAPKAYLGNYKVFGQPGVNEVTTSAAIIAALNDALIDGMDVINLSLGGSPRDPADDPEQQAIAYLSALGVVVVAAAGNAGPSAGSITSPGTSPEAITVGATSHSRVFRSILEISGSESPTPPGIETIGYVAGTGATIESVSGPWEIRSIVPLDSTELACTPLPAGSLAGKAALIRRGECTFTVKAANVLGAAGADAMVVYNNVEDPPVIMLFDDPKPTEPAVMIGLAEGIQLRDFVLDHPAEIIFHPEEAYPAQPDILAGFSGRGPSVIQQIKPDLTAPGTNVLTASHQRGEYRKGANGTSFAAPVLAGAAALIRQQHPNWETAWIKSILVNSASRTVTVGDRAASVNEAGNGRVDLVRAMNAKAALSPVSISFGLIDTLDDPAERQRSLTIRNIATSTLTFRFSTNPTDDPGPMISASPSKVTLDPGDFATVQVFLTDQSSSSSGVFEGYLQITDTGGGTDLTVPYWGVLAIEDDSRVLFVSKEGAPGSYSSIGMALARALPGDIIEILDSENYPGNLKVETNSQGIPLHGVTLRAAKGQSPTLVAGQGDPAPLLQVSNLENVTIQGLNLEGGETGILYQDSSGVIRDNRLSSEEPGGLARISLQRSSANLWGNHVSAVTGSGLTLFDSPALVQHNELGGESGLGEHGVFAGPSPDSFGEPAVHRRLSLFENVFENAGSSSIGQAVRISSTPALVKGNVIWNSPRNTSDGILAKGAETQITIADNVIRDHGRLGVWINSGVQAEFSGNWILRNNLAGLLIEHSRADLAADRLIENSIGIRASSSQLRLQNTLLALSGPAVEGEGQGLEATNSEVWIFNSTIAGNEGTGVELAGTEGRIANSIFYLNSGGDLIGQTNDSTWSNLFEGHELVGSAGNISGDPAFSDPGRRDFSLMAGSPAIDSGTTAVEVPAHDLDFHQRPVDGSGNGLAGVDMGALEYGSHTSPSLILPVLSSEAGEFVGLALANGLSPLQDPEITPPGPVTAVTIRHFSSNGKLLGEHHENIPLGSQVSVLLEEIFPGISEGWVQILPENREIMSFTLLGTGDLRYLDGAQLSETLYARLLFPEIRQDGTEATKVFLVNPKGVPAIVSLQRRATSGETLAEVQTTIPPGSMLSGDVDQIFNTPACSDPDCSESYVLVDSSHPIFGMEIFGNEEHRGGLLALDLEGGAQNLFAAQLAATSQIDTVINVVNTGGNTILTATARNDSGDVIGTPVNVPVPAGAGWRVSAREAFELTGDQVGWIEIHSLSSTILGNIVFGDPSGKFLSALPLQDRGAREFILSHVAQTPRIFTGVTLLNTGPGKAVVSVEVFDRDGERTGLALTELAAGRKKAQLLPEMIPGLTEQAEGFIRVRSNQPLLGFEIFGSYSLEYFSAVPQQVVSY